MGEITIHAKAYCKIVLHAAKYPHCAVNGVLLAKSSSSQGSKVEIVDAVPLFHVALQLTPMAEVALSQIDQYASAEGLTIAGYYTAPENYKDISFERAHHRISEKIAENFNGAILAILNSESLELNLKLPALSVAQYSDGKYREVNIQKIICTPTHMVEGCYSLLEKHAYKILVDFDNHLDDISEDWLNPEINKEIESIL